MLDAACGDAAWTGGSGDRKADEMDSDVTGITLNLDWCVLILDSVRIACGFLSRRPEVAALDVCLSGARICLDPSQNQFWPHIAQVKYTGVDIVEHVIEDQTLKIERKICSVRKSPKS